MSATVERTETRAARIARLEARLQDGFTRIGEQTAKGIAVDNWHVAWVKILREYEQVSDEIADHHAEVVPVQGRLLDAPVVREEVGVA